MKKIESLVEKLNMQIAQKASLDQLLVTVHMLQKEITGNLKEIDVLGAKAVAVIAPGVPNVLNLKEDVESQNSDKEYFELVVDAENDKSEEDVSSNHIPSYEEMEKIIQHAKREEGTKDRGKAQVNIILDSFADDLPTLSRQSKPTTRVARQAPKASKNSIKDLRKAIHTQDRLQYVKELFRGDENMFDRSLQTINNFNTLNEAEYWIMRELKTKNGWLSTNPLVQQFEQLVKRRFS